MAGGVALRHSLLFFFGNILPQIAALILLPLYTHYLTPQEFGVLEIINRIGELLVICLMLNGLRQSVVVITSQKSGQYDPGSVGFSVLVLIFCLLFLGGVLGWLFTFYFSGFFPGIDFSLCLLAFGTILIESAFLSFLCLTQARMEARLFLICIGCQVFLKTILCVLLVCGLGWGLFGVFSSSLLASGIVFLALGFREVVLYSGTVRFGLIWQMVQFSFPFIPAGICFFILNHGDRFLLLHTDGEEVVGLYALGYKVALAVSMFSRAPLMMAWGPRAYRQAENPGSHLFFGNVFIWIMSCYVVVGLVFCLFQDEIINVLGTRDYSGAAQVVGPVVLAYFFLSAADFMDCSFYIRGRTLQKTFVAVCTSLITILCYLVLIPKFSITGAALATLIGFFCHSLITYYFSYKLFPVKYQIPRMASRVGLAIGVWALSRFLHADLPGMLLKVVLFFLWCSLVWILGLVTRSEKSLVIGAVLQHFNLGYSFARRFFSSQLKY